jgi:signal transduction histidine kinase
MKKALARTVANGRMAVAMAERVLHIGAAKPAAPERVNVRAAVEDALAALCRDLSRDGIRVICNIDSRLTAWFDPLHLRQALFNLLLNAREAMSGTHSGRLTVSASVQATPPTIGEGVGFCRPNARVVLRIRDTGRGIPPDLLPHVFQPLESTKVAADSGACSCSGLGLALSKELIEEAGGRIAVESQAGCGTTFVIELPGEPPNEADKTE